MEQRKRVITFVTFFVCTVCLIFLTASLASHKWIVSKPVRINFLNATNADNHTVNEDDKDDDETGKFRGEIYFGLFQGTKVLNYGFGDRTTPIWSKFQSAATEFYVHFFIFVCFKWFFHAKLCKPCKLCI